KKEVPKERIEEGGLEYLNGTTNHKRERLLGVHGAKSVEEGVSWTKKLESGIMGILRHGCLK
ncbi:hypothetical protein, partial [Veillonella montpellierensis]